VENRKGSGRESGNTSGTESVSGQGIGQGGNTGRGPSLEEWAPIICRVNPHYARGATGAIMPGAVPGLVGML
jgi:hypothetical protein